MTARIGTKTDKRVTGREGFSEDLLGGGGGGGESVLDSDMSVAMKRSWRRMFLRAKSSAREPGNGSSFASVQGRGEAKCLSNANK